MIHIGASAETVEATAKALLDLMKSGAEQKTIRDAIKGLGTICQVSNVRIESCSFVNNEPPEDL